MKYRADYLADTTTGRGFTQLVLADNDKAAHELALMHAPKDMALLSIYRVEVRRDELRQMSEVAFDEKKDASFGELYEMVGLLVHALEQSEQERNQATHERDELIVEVKTEGAWALGRAADICWGLATEALTARVKEGDDTGYWTVAEKTALACRNKILDAAREPELPERPEVVCLCGSTRFWRQFQKSSLEETMAGKIVLSIGAASGTDDEHFGNLPREEYDRVKETLDELHLRKIDLSDEVLILNVDGYVGESTRRELDYARGRGKPVRWLEPEKALPDSEI